MRFVSMQATTPANLSHPRGKGRCAYPPSNGRVMFPCLRPHSRPHFVTKFFLMVCTKTRRSSSFMFLHTLDYFLESSLMADCPPEGGGGGAWSRSRLPSTPKTLPVSRGLRSAPGYTGQGIRGLGPENWPGCVT